MKRSIFEYAADALGLDDAGAEHRGKTSFGALADAKTKQVRERLSCEQYLKHMGAATQKTTRMAT